MPGFHNRYTGMPGLNSYSMPGSATCDTGHKAGPYARCHTAVVGAMRAVGRASGDAGRSARACARAGGELVIP